MNIQPVSPAIFPDQPGPQPNTRPENRPQKTPLKEQSQRLINILKQTYQGNLFVLEMQVSSLLLGQKNAYIRQDIIYQATGQQLPTKACTVLQVAESLKNHFDSPTLF